MLFILAFSLVIASVFLIIYRKNKDSILWLGLCTSLMLELCGVMLFIAKKGGISQEVLTFLYFSRNIYRKMQYFLITLGQLGYLIAIGRSLFPFFLLRIAMNYSMLPGLRKRKTWVKLSRVIPIMSLILYFPSVYRMIVHNRESMQEIIAKGNMIWINLYLTADSRSASRQEKIVKGRNYRHSYRCGCSCFGDCWHNFGRCTLIK